MIIALIMIIVIVAVLAVYNIHSKLNSIFMLIMMDLFVVLFCLVLYIAKTAYYNGIFNMEFLIYKFVRKIQINITSIKILMTIGYTMIFAAQTLMFKRFSNFMTRFVRIGILIFSMVIAALFAVVNFPVVSEFIYIYLCDVINHENVIFINDLLRTANELIIIYFCVLPIPAILTGIKRSMLIFRKRQNGSVAIILISVDIIIIMATFFTRIQNLLNIYMLSMFSPATAYYAFEFSPLLPIGMIIMLAIVTVGIIKFDVFDSVDFFKSRIMTSKMKVYILDLKYIFHDFKNIMLTIIALKSVAEKNYGNEQGLEALKKIEETAYNYAEKVNDFLDVYKSKKMSFDRTDLMNSLKNAVSRAENETKIPVYIRNLPENSVINGDPFQLETVFYNLVKNAAEAVDNKKASDGKVEIRFIEEDNWICVEITDNGNGMSANEIKKVFKPFTTSKNTFMNWGIGLNQVKGIVDAHLGHIDIKTKKDKFTLIQTSFPKSVK